MGNNYGSANARGRAGYVDAAIGIPISRLDRVECQRVNGRDICVNRGAAIDLREACADGGCEYVRRDRKGSASRAPVARREIFSEVRQRSASPFVQGRNRSAAWISGSDSDSDSEEDF